MVLVINNIHDRLRDNLLESVLRTKLRFSVKIRTNTGGWQYCNGCEREFADRRRPRYSDENTSYCAPGRYHNTSERPGAKESWVFTGI